MKHLVFIPAFIILVLTSTSCRKDTVNGCDSTVGETVSFNSTILPMMQNNCTGCHDVGNTTGYTITDYSNISSNARAIINAMNGSGAQLMPQGGPALPDTTIQKFQDWLCQGLKNN